MPDSTTDRTPDEPAAGVLQEVHAARVRVREVGSILRRALADDDAAARRPAGGPR